MCVCMCAAGGLQWQHLDVAQLVKGLHVELVVLLRSEERGAKLAKHGGAVSERLAQVVLVLGCARCGGAVVVVVGRTNARFMKNELRLIDVLASLSHLACSSPPPDAIVDIACAHAC